MTTANVFAAPVYVEAHSALHGFATFRTAAPEWQQLNEMVAMVAGAANPGARSLVIEAQGLRTLWHPQSSLRLRRAAATCPDTVAHGVVRCSVWLVCDVVAAALRRKLYPVPVTRRVDDEITYDHPVWRVPVPADVAGKIVAVVDEIADTGETIRLVRDRVAECDAAGVVTATRVAHS